MKQKTKVSMALRFPSNSFIFGQWKLMSSMAGPCNDILLEKTPETVARLSISSQPGAG